MRVSAFCTAVLTYVVIGHPPPAVAQVDQSARQGAPRLFAAEDRWVLGCS
jgi:hypothetical protein